MRGKEIAFFAVDDDLRSILEEIEMDFDIQYVEMGSFETSDAVKYFSFCEIPDLGFTQKGDWGSDRRYMIIHKDSVLNIREVPQTRGLLRVRFLIDPLKNPDSIELTTNGIYTKKENVIIAGRTAIVSEYPFANAVYKSLSSKIKKKFKRIGGYYVGPKAEEKLKAGWRLVQIEGSPREYDLAYTTE